MVIELKKGGCCDDCGFDNPLALDFAHFDRTDKARTRLGKPICLTNLSIKRLIPELEIVRLLCRVCHGYETRDEQVALQSESTSAVLTRKSKEHLYDLVGNEKLFRGSCIDYGLEVTTENYFVFDFDHRPGSGKTEVISRMVAKLYPEDEILAEMDKCDLRCKNCHQIITWIRAHPNNEVDYLQSMVETHSES